MKSLKLEDFDYKLAKELIAQSPTQPRDSSRLLLFSKSTKKISHDRFFNLDKYLQAGDLLVLNDTQVSESRLFANKLKTGAKIEVFLVKNLKNREWEALLKGRVKEGDELVFKDDLRAILKQSLGNGLFVLSFNQDKSKLLETLKKIALVPLPPYIKSSGNRELDKQRYQTIYAKGQGFASVAAPTAGLHFTLDLLERLKKKGVILAKLSLEVSLGTFSPIRDNNFLNHKMHSESYSLNKKTAQLIYKAKQEGRRIVAVGTSSTRVLESYAQKISNKALDWGAADQGETDIFIYPGYKFLLTDALISNFHLPKSSLLLLVSAFSSREDILRAYKEAIALKYRFYSYGDAMFLF